MCSMADILSEDCFLSGAADLYYSLGTLLALLRLTRMNLPCTPMCLHIMTRKGKRYVHSVAPI